MIATVHLKVRTTWKPFLTDTAAKRTAHEQNTELPVSVVFPVCNQNLLRKQKIPVARSLKPKLKSYETNLRVKIVSLVS